MGRYDFEDDEPYVVIEQRDSGVGPFLVGAVTGAIVALLFAPKPGAETREELRRSARRVQEKARDLVDNVAETVGETIEGARSAVEERVEGARGAVEMKREQMSSAIDAGRAAARQAREDLERRIAENKAIKSTQSRSGSINPS